MAKQASQDLNELRDQRESLIRQIDAIQQGDDSPIQQKGYRTAEPLRDARLDEVDKLRQLLTELEERIQGLEDDGAADTSQLASQLEELTPRHGARLAIARTARPWLLPVNALVLSVGVQGGMQGGLSQAMRSDLDESVWQELRSHIQSAVSAIDPETPVLVTLPDALGQQLLPNAPETPDKNANGRYQIIAATPARPNSDALDPSATAKAIIKLATENNIEQLAIPLLGSGRAGLESVRTAEKMLKAIYWAIPDTNNPLKQITLTTRPTADDDKSEVVAAARRTIAMLNANRAQKLSADSATGDDTLGIKTEVFALAETLLLRDVETPLAVGVLGGWGSGKSFVMYLMQQEMMRIRSLKVVDGWDAGDSEPYVGHVYPIEFNAWTYAKSDLWASLMQTIFMELNRQLSLEGLFRNREGEGEKVRKSCWTAEVIG